MSTQRELAFSIASDAHKGQPRKLGDDKGKPYIVHPLRVSGHFHGDDVVEAAALLHDVIEDTSVTAEDMLKMGVSQAVVDLVLVLTRRKGENYLEYIFRIKDNPQAIKLKLADLADNMQSLPEGTLLDKYRMAQFILGRKLNIPTYEALYADDVIAELTSDGIAVPPKENFTCAKCLQRYVCELAWDLYNTHGDCLAMK